MLGNVDLLNCDDGGVSSVSEDAALLATLEVCLLAEDDRSSKGSNKTGGGEDKGDELKPSTGCRRFDCAKQSLSLWNAGICGNMLGGDDKGDELKKNLVVLGVMWTEA
ncbi:uncharacterized protein ColSpa_12144 [Colletotrichum spaethianum]|uniref:Uncharacterized protein n=1 Tax=Colletotrichum spaethianum TaxID=700344 RepID=A0AA37UTI1_9PEZI|nr:uncharacterized protein ColSpa_12144 [Colletotrichum spaethianum]GKT51963.1 hypothetical protein ColSpa_12144 [Colletotrichum spaethianum]